MSTNAARPTWANTLKSAFEAMHDGAPRNLFALLSALGAGDVTQEQLRSFLTGTDQNDAAITAMRIAFGKWDSRDDFEDSAPVSTTDPHSPERRLAAYAALDLDDDTRAVIDALIPVVVERSVVISKLFEPWYDEQRPLRPSIYWDHYHDYLLQTKGWDPDAVTALDKTTTEVVRRLSDPTRETAKQAKGLVVGYVQSGKTANFTGVAAKAIDAGYRLVIVLTGTIEILRSQTQRRMDMELMGVENILAGLDPNDPETAKELDYQNDEDYLAGKFVSHGAALNMPGIASISRITTHSSDYKRLPQGLTRLSFHLTDKSRPLNDPVNLFNSDAYVAVIKKNAAPLKKLIKDLTPLKHQLADLPVLIIDDESDQASLDTTNPARFNKNSKEARKRTTINKLITEILGLCPRAQYVGYTATPFANVFVDPDDDSDLFPADFVLSLDRPPGYMGVREFHDVGKNWEDEEKNYATSNKLAHVRTLKAGPLPGDTERRAELRRAIDAWVLSGAIKKYREAHGASPFRHHTMLVHESVKTATHADTAEDVREAWNNGQFGSSSGLIRLAGLFDEDFKPVMDARADGMPVPATFKDLEKYVGLALAEMTKDGSPILVVNSDKEIQSQQKKLDFEAERVWRILIGGTQLSRGFTVEGLTISYFRRKAGQADTLMQAGRWFGFRPGYQDLVRLYIQRDDKVDLYKAFEALLLDEEAFREELRQYEGFDDDGMPLVEPRHIPPLVSQHLPWLRPTARNKMWNAVISSKATARGVQDLYDLPDRGDPALTRNLENVGIPLLQVATDAVSFDVPDTGWTFDAKTGRCDAPTFLELLRLMEWNPGGQEKVRPLLRFISDATESGAIDEWQIVWPQPAKMFELLNIEPLGAAAVIKRGRRAERHSFVGSDNKHRAATLPLARGKSAGGLPAKSGRGVALVYLVDDRENGSTEPLDVNHVVPLIAIATPDSATPNSRDIIRWTVRSTGTPESVTVNVSASADGA